MNPPTVPCPHTAPAATGRRFSGQFHPGRAMLCQQFAYRGATMDVTDWLRSLGLEGYEAAFRSNAVTADLLPGLTAEDLKDLGVAAVGHRRRLLDAIATLRGNGGPAAHLSV